MKLRKLNRVLHRDISYFFAGMALIYSISGIALNHLHQWNPNYIITKIEFNAELPKDTSQINKELIESIVSEQDDSNILSYYYPKKATLKAFVKGGTVTFNLESGTAVIEKAERRPFFAHLNFLHYNNPRKWWTAFSDAFAVGLIVITITGLFIVKGKNGITRRGAVLTLAGLIFPIIALILYFS
ncbi:MAG TPA: PepSY-associated TM helix domain-containing protein [Tenuifilaceae bacterium]|nr:PepSY-associated TM helix domain-containing protein [Tenuifilaceae bacterium]